MAAHARAAAWVQPRDRALASYAMARTYLADATDMPPLFTLTRTVPSRSVR